MIKLLKLLGKYKKETILGPLFKMFEALFELFVPLVIASLMKDGNIIEKGNHQELINTGGFYKELYESQFAK